MTGIIYAHPPDYLMASLVARCLQRQGVRAVVAIDWRDPFLKIDGVEVLRTRFDRMKNLNGKDFICGNYRLMLELAAPGDEYVIKCDADTLPLAVWLWLKGRTEAAVGIDSGPEGGSPYFQGCCYALSVAALPAMLAEAERSLPGGWIAEDQYTGWLAMHAGPVWMPRAGEGKYGSYRSERGMAFHAQRGDLVVNFPLRRKGMDRRKIARAMEEFLGSGLWPGARG